MAVVGFEIKDFESLGYTKGRLAELLPAVGLEVEGMTDAEVRTNVTPNRPDLLDFIGVLRLLDSFTGKSVPNEGRYTIKNQPVMNIEVAKEVKEVRPFIAGLVVKNVDLSGNTLKYLISFTDKFADTYGRRRAKLAIGLHNLDAIEGSELVYGAAAGGEEQHFVPLNSAKQMSFSEAVRSTEKGRTYGYTLGGAGTRYPFLKDSKKVLALIPIINSEATRVTEKTRELFVDITGTSRGTIDNAANLLACSFMYSGAEVYPVTVEYKNGAEVTPKPAYREVKVSLRNAERTLGVELGRHNVIGLANKMGYVAAKYGGNVQFFVPPYRVDVLNDQDVIEDLAISFGYDNIVAAPVSGYVDGLADELTEEENDMAVFMIGIGYTEAINSSLTNEKVNFENMRRKASADKYISIADSKTLSVSMLRTALLPALMQNLRESMNERMPHRMFEIGRVYGLEDKRPREAIHIALVSEHARANFAEIRSAVDEILKYTEMKDVEFKEARDEAFIAGRCASVVAGDNVVGVLGEMHPEVLERFGLEEPTVGAELTIVKEIKYEV